MARAVKLTCLLTWCTRTGLSCSGVSGPTHDRLGVTTDVHMNEKQLKLLAVLISAFSAMLLTGCDTISGSRRTVQVHRLPEASAVVAALKSVPGVQRVMQREAPPQTSWGLYVGVRRDPAFNLFSFATTTTGGVVETKQDSEGVKTVSVYSYWMNHTPSKAKFDETRALLDAAYLSLRREESSLPPPEELKETLIRYPSK